MTLRIAFCAVVALCQLLVACTGTSNLRSTPLERSWELDPASRLRPPATLVFQAAGERRIYLCVDGRIFACPESGAGRVEAVWDGSRPVAAIAPAGSGGGLLVVEASAGSAVGERMLWTDLVGEPRELFVAEGCALGVPLRIGSRDAQVASTSLRDADRALFVTADMQGRRAARMHSAQLDAVYQVARHPHTGRTLASGVRRNGLRADSGLFELSAGLQAKATLIDADAWCPTWSGCGKHLALASGRRSEHAALVQYGPLEQCRLRVTSANGRTREATVDGVVLAMCFDPSDEDLLFAAVADAEELRARELSSVRILRIRVARDGLRTAEVASVDLRTPLELAASGL